MKSKLACSVVVVIAIPLGAIAADRPRVFVTESQSLQLSSEAVVEGTKGSLSITSGTSPQNVEVMKVFIRRCPDVVVTANPEKADYVVRLDHAEANPTTLFVRGNKVAVFDKNEDLIYSNSTRLLSNAVKGACAAITGRSRQ